MEDILDSSKRIAADGDAGGDDTYNFQKASCTLDASIKIYSYRVDDTWNSSYKILENLSRTGQKHGVEEAASDEERGTTTARKTRKTHARTIEKNLNNINLKSYDTECEADPLFHKMSQSFDEGGAKGMLLANLSVYDGCKILLNSSDVSLVTRKPIHGTTDPSPLKDSALKEKEKSGKKSAKASSSESAVQDKDDTKTATAEIESNEKENDEENAPEAEKIGDSESTVGGENKKNAGESEQKSNGSNEDAEMEEEQDKVTEGSSGDDATNQCKEKEGPSDDASTDELEKENENASEADGEQVEEGDSNDAAKTTTNEDSGQPPVAKERISLSLFGNLSCIDQNVQNLSVCPPLYRMYDQLDELYGDESRHKLGIKNDFLLTTPVKGRRMTLDKPDTIAMNLAGIMEGASEDESDGEDAAQDTAIDFGDDNVDYDADEDGGDTVGDAEEVAEVKPTDDINIEKDKDVIDLAGSDNESSVHDDFNEVGVESGTSALDKESSLTSSAADFFRAKVNENLPENYENSLFSQMIESALVRSATLEDEQGEDNEGKNDYSYFDVKMLRNWAGPGHWKFPGARRIQTKQRSQDDMEKDGLEVDEDGVIVKAEPGERPAERPRKGSTAGAEKKAAVLIDFFGEAPDLSRLKAPKSASSLEISKGNLKKQLDNASDLVLPVDTHIEIGLFFRHFLKERPRFFRKRGSGVMDGIHREGPAANSFEESNVDTVDDIDRDQPFTYNEDSAGFEGGYDDEEDDGTSGADDPGTEALYSVEGLVQADRVVEKIGVHFERFAKRVDVKKLKGSIWDHLEKKVVKSREKVASSANNDEKADNSNQTDTDVTVNESGKRPREADNDQDDDSEGLNTTFENVVENVSGKVPSNVTVSFYFICVLHLANEKGLELVGQDDLRNFQIRKEN
ncbi:unnamed protein product [Phytophthora fragariaefolia]|uniref:Condensin complex subunit 2 n=1 Tax=Phytophthora fragariaefolia TaxID=1490495 RepID=A0A9W6XJU2_9STRA|nr:unnamed protein product [Phytophthora fragariaefolia]